MKLTPNEKERVLDVRSGKLRQTHTHGKEASLRLLPCPPPFFLLWPSVVTVLIFCLGVVGRGVHRALAKCP